MRLADMHIHTTFSPDGKSSMEEQCIKAIEIGIPIICFTDLPHSAGDAAVGGGGLPGAVDHAAHNGHGDGLVHGF